MVRAGIMAGLVISMSTGDLLRLDRAEIGRGSTPGWQVRPVKGRSAPEFEIRGDGPDRVLRISGTGQAAWLYRDLRRASVPGGSILRWSWRVLEAPLSADMRVKQADDSPIRVYVVFGNPRALFGGPGRIVFYSFGNEEPDGYAASSHVSGRIHIIRVDGAADRGGWRDHMADLTADYRRIWHRDPPAITAIGLMQDTDQTGGRAVAEVRELRLDLPPAVGGDSS